MSQIVVLFDLPTMTQAQYDTTMTALKATGQDYQAERVSHVAFQKGSAWCVIDVWNSEEAFMNFGQNVLFGIFARLGIDPPQPQIYPTHNFIGN